jgi:hypothetical protein
MGVSDIAQAVAVSGAKRQAGALLALLGIVGVGCQEVRQEQCRVFAATADACYTQAGPDPFFQESVDCSSPASTLRDYRCLVAAYEEADCPDPLAAYEAVDAASLQCLGWNEDLAAAYSAGDDDSAR